MQLATYWTIGLCLVSWGHILGQTGEADSLRSGFRKLDPVEISILFSYYAQDGDHAAVTGGTGTEKLTDWSPRILAIVPVRENIRLNIDAGFDYYSSASTDNIDRSVSSASSSDIRGHADVGFTITDESRGMDYGLRLGGSAEYDYTSLIAGGSFSRYSPGRIRELSFSAQVFFDRWTPYFPAELRREGPWIDTDKRRSYNASLTYAQVINRRMQLSVSLEGIYMTGLLSTPFHRVYFQEQSSARVERLPAVRLKLPVGLRFNYYINDWLLGRIQYRYYRDDWSVRAHTVGLELPLKVDRFFSIYPFLRYHTQTAADYFAPYKQHRLDREFYTSDHDLSAVSSRQYGLGVRYSPAGGWARLRMPVRKRDQLVFKGIELRYARYTRSDGLKAGIISLGVHLSL